MPLAAVVSDDTELVIVVSHILDARGWATLTVRESTALASIRRERPQLVIFDFRSERPDSSWLLLEQLRKDVLPPTVPILVTARAPQALYEQEERLSALGARLLPRSFTATQFVGAMEDLRAKHTHSVDDGASSGAT